MKDPNASALDAVPLSTGADAIVTFNQRDFEPAARLFGVELWTPRQALAKLGA
jgi:hypothetical protein